MKSFLEHLSSLETVKNIRQKQRQGAHQERHPRDVSDYKWEELVGNCILASLTKAELDKYLDHHKLCKKGKKGNKTNYGTLLHEMRKGHSQRLSCCWC